MDVKYLYLFTELIITFAATNGCRNQFPEVKTQSNVYQGIRESTPNDKFFYESYLGVQYADFTERFRKASYPPKPFHGVFNATRLGNRCIQLEQYKFPFEQDDAEDCLNLNIYVPWGVQCLKSRKLSVVVGIHGTAAHIAGGAILEVVRDVIFISIQYRLGVWGLMTTGDDTLPGNLVYWDQHYAIRWIHDNIEYFGGNPNEITLWGYSAGGVSAAAQVLFKGNQGLIKRSIPITGAGFELYMGYWNCFARNVTIENTKKLAQALGCPREPSWTLVQCLQEVDNQKLLLLSNSPEIIGDKPVELRWNTIIDGEFLEDVPYQLFKLERTKGVEFMHGFGTYDAGHFLRRDFSAVENTMADIDDFWPRYMRRRGFELKDELYNNIKDYYGHDIHPSSEQAAVLLTEKLRALPHIQDLKYHEKFTSAKNNYLYTFNHQPSYSSQAEWVKGDHVDVIVFGFGIILSYPDVFPTTEAEKELSRDMLRYQFNFAKTGNPNIGSGVPTLFPQWNMETRRMLRFTSTADCGYSVDSDAYKGVEEFWEPYLLYKENLDKDKLCTDL